MMHPDVQKLQDMLAAMQRLRDEALNGLVLALAEHAALKRTVADRDSRIKALDEEIAKLKPSEATNGQ